MKQPTLTFKINQEDKTYPITNIHFDQFGNVFSVSMNNGETYTFYRNNEGKYFNSHGNLECIINW